MANATPLQIAAIYKNALGRTNVDAEGLAYWSQHPIEDLLNTAQGITGNTIDPNTYKPVGTSTAVAPGASTAIANAAAIDPGYSTAGYAAGRQAIDPKQATVAANSGLWKGNTVDNVANGQGATQTLFTPPGGSTVVGGGGNDTITTGNQSYKNLTGQAKVDAYVAYARSLNPLIRAAQDKEHGAGTPDTFQITPGAGKTVASELQKWNNLDNTIDPAYAQMFNDMNGWYMKNKSYNMPENSDGYQMMPGSKWINDPIAAKDLFKSFDERIATDKKPGLLQKALPILAAVAAAYATGPAGAGWWGTGASSTLTGTQLNTLLSEGVFTPAEIATMSGKTVPELVALSSTAGPVGAGTIAALTGGNVSTIKGFLDSGMTAAQVAALGAGALGVIDAANQPDSKTTSTDPWGPQQAYLKDLFSKAQNLSNQPALSIDQKLAQKQADDVRMSIMSQDSSKGFGMQKLGADGKPVNMATARPQSLFSPDVSMNGQVTQDAYANLSLFSNGQSVQNDPVTQSIWDMYANDPTARQYNPNGPDQAAIDYWKGQIAEKGLPAVQNGLFQQQVASTAAGQAPTTEGMASTTPTTGGGFGQQPSQYSQTLANANINPYLDATVTPGKIDPLANNAYLGKTTNVGTNSYLGKDNPYLQKMIDYSASDISNAWLPETMRLQRQSGAFGNSGLDQQRQKELLAAQARNSDTLRFQDYLNQVNLSESDVTRKAQYGAADLTRNTALQQDINKTNAGIQDRNISNLIGTQQNDLARNSELWNAGANRDLGAFQFNIGQQLGTANGNPAYIQAQQDNLWSPILNYNRALTGGVSAKSTTEPLTTSPWTAGLGAAYTGYKLFGG